jgi:protein-S-isoprenylcysteine O-methyltransferase Ste14
MNALELKIPPPVVLLAIGAAMWGLARVVSAIPMDLGVRIAAGLVVAVLGGFIAIRAAIAFRRAQTIIDPMTPEKTASIVMGDVFRFTRNPMYVGQTLVLVGWALFLAAPWTLVGPVIFVLYVTRFQILPEERVLSEKFGGDFLAYMSKVRRWL